MTTRISASIRARVRAEDALAGALIKAEAQLLTVEGITQPKPHDLALVALRVLREQGWVLREPTSRG